MRRPFCAEHSIGVFAKPDWRMRTLHDYISIALADRAETRPCCQAHTRTHRRLILSYPDSRPVYYKEFRILCEHGSTSAGKVSCSSSPAARNDDAVWLQQAPSLREFEGYQVKRD